MNDDRIHRSSFIVKLTISDRVKYTLIVRLLLTAPFPAHK
jgi:hypothetical protein